MELKDAVRVLRKMKGWSALRLSKESGVSRQYIDNIETGGANLGSVSYPILAKLARALWVPVEQLTGEQDIPRYDERDAVIAELEDLASQSNSQRAEILMVLAREFAESEQRWIEFLRASHRMTTRSRHLIALIRDNEDNGEEK